MVRSVARRETQDMYEFVDRRVTGLGLGGRFMIWAMRQWIETLGEGRCPCSGIGPTFQKWGMMAGFPHFHLMMAVLNRDATEQLRFAPVDHDHVTEHQALMLSMVAGSHAADDARTQGTVSLIVRPQAVDPVTMALAGLAEALAAAGLLPTPVPGAASGPDRESFPHE